jgi:hypothetical protein
MRYGLQSAVGRRLKAIAILKRRGGGYQKTGYHFFVSHHSPMYLIIVMTTHVFYAVLPLYVVMYSLRNM